MDCIPYSGRRYGIGMGAEYLPHIFEEFTRERTSTESKVVGAGLGLPIVKALIDLMGGTIQVESERAKAASLKLFCLLRSLLRKRSKTVM